MSDLSTHYSCVVDDDPKFLLQTHIFIHSLLSLGVKPKAIFINFVFDDEEVINAFADKGVNVSVYNKFGDKKYCNKLVQFSNKSLLNCDYIFLCDCDIGFVKPLDALVKSAPNHIIGKVVDAANPPLSLLQSVFEHYDKNIGNVVDVHGGRSSAFNINGGFVGFPVALFKSFGERWKHYALDMLNNADLVDMLNNYSKHIDQISFSLTASEFKAFKNIDARFNFPVHSSALIELNKSLANDIHCIHYHDCFTATGLIKKVNNAQVDRYLEQLNKVITSNFNNKFFWNFRYKYFPELGSGQGSRGEVKEQKRQLLLEFGIECSKSVLDIGCGDGETLHGLNIENYIGVDISQAAIEQHKIKREHGQFIHAESAQQLPKEVTGDLTLCFEVLIHQSTIEDFDTTLSKLIAATNKRLIISGYESAEYLDKSHMCFFHRPLKEALIDSGKFTSIKKVTNYHNLVVYVADTHSDVAKELGQFNYNPRTLVCTGFHRSATSVTANYLNSAGLNLGANLMAGGISNAKGHFEDWDVVQLHNDLLEESSTDWQFHDECKLESDIEGFQGYVKKRSSQFDQWGVKDPRACLFLEDWNEVLGDSGRYLFIVRHWSSCIESLLHRHSREFAHKMGDVDANHAGIKFWLDVSLAAKMWLSYNKRLLDFAKRNNQKVLLVTQRALFEGASILDYLNDKFGFNLNTEVNSPFDPYLLRDQANQSIHDTLSYSLRVQLEQVHNDLLSLCQFKSTDEEPVYIKVNQFTENELTPLYEAIKQRLELSAMEDISTTEINAVTWLEKLILLVDAEQVIQQCNSISQPILNGLNITKLQFFLDEKFNLNGDVLLAFAKLLVRKKAYELAINYFQRAITVGVYFPFMDMFIGQCYQALSFNVEAEFFFDKAIKANPNNAIFYTNKAKFLVSVNKLDEAKTAFELGYEKGMNKPVNVLPYCDYLIQHNKEIQAKQLLQALVAETNNTHAKTRLTQLILSDNFDLGKIHYLETFKANIAGKNRYDWLAELCTLLDFGASENDLIQRIYLHWKEVDSI